MEADRETFGIRIRCFTSSISLVRGMLCSNERGRGTGAGTGAGRGRHAACGMRRSNLTTSPHRRKQHAGQGTGRDQLFSARLTTHRPSETTRPKALALHCWAPLRCTAQLPTEEPEIPRSPIHAPCFREHPAAAADTRCGVRRGT